MPTNLYGPGDNFHPTNSHVMPALIRRFVEAKEAGAAEVVCWGSGSPRREFLHVDDLADACLFLLDNYSDLSHVNVGYGDDVTIKELTEAVRAAAGFAGAIAWDSSKPDGTPRKLMDSSQINRLGRKPAVPLEDGVRRAYRDFLGR